MGWWGRISSRVAARWLTAATTPVPAAFPESEIGLMTREEFLAFKNPQGKHHDSGTYDFDVVGLNRALDHFGRVDRDRRDFVVYRGDGYVIFDEADGKPVAVVHNGTMYYSSLVPPNQVPKEMSLGPGRDLLSFGVERMKAVKYVSEYVPLVSDVARRNRKRFPHLLQNITVGREPYQVRAEKPPVENNGTTLAVINARGEVVAQASDEWGATLLTVAREYRGKGLGKVIGRFWYELNPRYTSGGFTPQGEANALRLWEDRVREFMRRGWYSEMIRQGRVTHGRVLDILAGLTGRARTVDLPGDPTPEGREVEKPDLLVYAEDYAFVVYDTRFLTEEPDEDHIHGHGFFRDAPRVGTFLYTIDYERPHAKITTAVAMQMARDMGEKVYVGEGYGDMLELDTLGPAVERDGDHVSLNRDLLPLGAMAALERRARRAVDPYGERKALLLEMAESKWR